MIGRHRGPRLSPSAASIVLVAIASAALAQSQAADAPSVTLDLDGDGDPETAVVLVSGAKVRLEIRGATGRRIARAEVPAPESREPVVALSAGSLGSAGALLRVRASGGERECGTVWRFREGRLTRLPLVVGETAQDDCAPAGESVFRWEGDGVKAPAALVRERARQSAGGLHRRTDVFVFSGFRLERDPRRSYSEIRGVTIPTWFAAELYPRANLEGLAERFDLSALKSGVRLHIETDAERGVFDLAFRDGSGERRERVVRSEPPPPDSDPGAELTAGDPQAPVRAAVTLRNGNIPVEVRVTGAGERFDALYGPAIRFEGGRIEIYPTAEQAIASGILPGTWTNASNERWDLRAAAGDAVVESREARFAVRLAGAPDGSDILLAPEKPDGAPWAITLKGPNSLARVRVRCGGAGASPECFAEGSPEVLRRLGSAMNVR